MSEWKEVRLGDLCYRVCSGGTPKSTCSVYKDGEIAFGSTEYIVMTAKESLFPEFLYTLCRFPSFVNYAVKNMNGSSGRQRVSGETISNYRMVIAPESVYSSVRPLFQEYMLRIRECGFENLRLSTLRDTLLPRLMSGKLKVNKIKI
jgi:type I restriction enzyme S subunit